MKLKVIVSHDVDHLFGSDHWGRDLIYPKLWLRTIIKRLNGEISAKCARARMTSPFERNRNRISEMLAFDESHAIPSSFFFGMAQGLGLSYTSEECRDTILRVKDRGFDVGVHGIAFNNFPEIELEHNRFAEIIGTGRFGIRTHYVRMDDCTEEYFSKAGYLFDTSVFDKGQKQLSAPYKIGEMWEFPLCMMDGYTIVEGDSELTRRRTESVVSAAEQAGIPYLTVLFHDYLFNEEAFPDQRNWYVWLINYLEHRGCEFISYKDAIVELEEEDYRNDGMSQ